LRSWFVNCRGQRAENVGKRGVPSTAAKGVGRGLVLRRPAPLPPPGRCVLR
jgi:hypothetical protein